MDPEKIIKQKNYESKNLESEIFFLCPKSFESENILGPKKILCSKEILACGGGLNILTSGQVMSRQMSLVYLLPLYSKSLALLVKSTYQILAS